MSASSDCSDENEQESEHTENIPDMDVLPSPLLDCLKIGIRYLNCFLERERVYLNLTTLYTSN